MIPTLTNVGPLFAQESKGGSFITGQLVGILIIVGVVGMVVLKSFMQRGGGVNKDVNSTAFWVRLGMRGSFPVVMGLASMFFMNNMADLLTDQLALLYELHDGLVQVGDDNAARLYTEGPYKDLGDRYKKWQKKFEDFLSELDLEKWDALVERRKSEVLIKESAMMRKLIGNQVTRLQALVPSGGSLSGLAAAVEADYKTMDLDQYIIDKVPKKLKLPGLPVQP